ncbi:uncharacterized protein BDZ99DRAFT_473724 [Mytilinidion resinicola]|uniref:Uncharacterized protein n=1 Tax=Mytilinidion resinicola TaxID=574789 RepID=A0A6A6YYG2_9PEZI|nr:uncharacterized protein BDZ99DRAFT_473724 [Mytilinidion resinicola]KAF2812987.1 hypothetical protein BDZ99DRAFT_473724 [Mytilinidion resinicola]
MAGGAHTHCSANAFSSPFAAGSSRFCCCCCCCALRLTSFIFCTRSEAPTGPGPGPSFGRSDGGESAPGEPRPIGVGKGSIGGGWMCAAYWLRVVLARQFDGLQNREEEKVRDREVNGPTPSSVQGFEVS